MTTIKAFLSGTYPRSEKLVKISRDHDRKRATDNELAQVLLSDRQNLWAAQKQADMDYFTDGLLNWHDDFRPFSTASDDVDTGALTRYFNTNTFYRQPCFDGPVAKLDVTKLAPYWWPGEDKQSQVVTLPGPVSFAMMSNQHQNVLEVTTQIVCDAANWFCAAGVAAIQFKEPWPSYHSAQIDSKLLAQFGHAWGNLLARLKETYPDVGFGIHLPFGNTAPILATIAEKPFDFIGVDFYETTLDSLKDCDWSDRILVAGCVNGRESFIEDSKAVFAFCENAIKSLQPKKLCLSNSVDLCFLPEPIAQKKVALLGDLKRTLSEAQ